MKRCYDQSIICWYAMTETKTVFDINRVSFHHMAEDGNYKRGGNI